ncbi:MAG TPA: FxDxF family PEP-CTERM protein, partial [Burkholderiaceae bacterium]|nr:FxDxF family PEP-CTERM protein [Burkholderiaceae bacterium]
KAVTMTQAGGGLFSLDGLDVAELWRAGEPLNDFYQVSLTGNQFGGGVLSMLIELDGVADGPGGANDFQTIALGGWTNLMSVTITGVNAVGGFGDYSIDNLLVNVVPEPGTYALMLAGLGLVGFMARRRIS